MKDADKVSARSLLAARVFGLASAGWALLIVSVVLLSQMTGLCEPSSFTREVEADWAAQELRWGRTAGSAEAIGKALQRGEAL